MTEQELEAAYEAELQRHVWSDGRCHLLNDQLVPAPVPGEDLTEDQQEVLRLIWNEKNDEERAFLKQKYGH